MLAMNKSILIIDDDSDLRQSLKNGLEKEGFLVVTAPNAEFATDVMDRVIFDAIILDRMMPGTDGLSFLRKIRGAGNQTPVIMLTAMTGSDNSIDGLSTGADDYIAKPFHLRELVLRINNILKKSEGTRRKTITEITIIDGEFFIGKELLALSIAEKDALSQMIAGNTVQIVPMVAKRLRTKLLANTKNTDIITVRGKGYKIINKK
jgi:DNA-binding response OmpR family regulator